MTNTRLAATDGGGDNAPMRVLFIEPFYGGSHRAFADGIIAHSTHDITLLSLPEGEWRRRMRRGAQELAALADALTGEFDAIVATDMLDVAAFLALTRPRFAHTPVLLYFHENQFTYPRIRGTKLNSWFGQINYLSALAADRVAFNSAFHREEFLAALRTLAGQPNNWLVPESIETIAERSSVLPVGLDFDWLDGLLERREPPTIAWNSRWEFDKAPEMFARTATWLAEEDIPFRLALCGDPGPNPHPALVELRAALGDRVVQSGLVEDRAEYARILRGSEIVVSTSRHEFFGIGMVEAMYAGCLPIAPHALNYPALVPEELHARCLYLSEAELRERLRDELVQRSPAPVETLRRAAGRFAWEKVAPEWDAALAALPACSFDKTGRDRAGSETVQTPGKLD